MKTKQTIILSVMIFMSYGLLAAGTLEPAGPPAPTMKTLDEIEPRIPIPASSTAAPTFIISKSGSYYLQGNRLCSGTGIQVNYDDVTIDLNGYKITGSGTGYGIYMNNRKNVEICNGTVRGFQSGIYEPGSESSNHRILNIRSTANTKHGIYLYGLGHLVKDCTVTDNANSASSSCYGIYTLFNATVVGNVVCRNGDSMANFTTFRGIYADSGSIIADNVCSLNGDNSLGSVSGIYAGVGCRVTENTAHDNGYNSSGDVDAIYASTASTVTGNTVYNNGYSADGTNIRGIFAGFGCSVIGNTVYGNGQSATGNVYGIKLSDNCMVDQNTTYLNGATNMTLGVTGCVYGNNVAP